ncbi:MAG: polysaccharide biosynthesis tyrosine autokinase [Desulfobacterales bacterium]|nr:MAG: polysaccharide biosynthesis tyrosine autokinase [Desulfobacterales bacterium]
MGKIFDALEKFRKERKTVTDTPFMTKLDWEALLQYDRQTGMLDIGNQDIIKDAETVQRLLLNKMIMPDGQLTPAAIQQCQRLEIQQRPKTLENFEPGSREEEIEGRDLDMVGLSNLSGAAQGKTSNWQENNPSEASSVSRGKAAPATFPEPGQETPPEDNDSRTGIDAPPYRAPSSNNLFSISEEKPKFTAKADKQKVLRPTPDRQPEIHAAMDTTARREKKETASSAAEIEPFKTAKGPRAEDERSRSPKALFTDLKDINANLVTIHDPHSFEAEQFKILRSNILFPLSGKAPRIVMITSAAPGEGKSFVSSNLAISVALNINRHVLLIDTDLRRPAIHQQFGIAAAPGLSEYLTDGASLPPLLQRIEIERLTILPAGNPPPNPAELLSSERMSTLLKEVTGRYPDRLIIIDSPPPTLTAETRVLGGFVDGVILVVRFGYTRREHVTDLIEHFGKEKIIGTIFNGVDVRSSRYYGYRKYGKRSHYYNDSELK